MYTALRVWRLFRRPGAVCNNGANATKQFFGELIGSVPQRILAGRQFPEQVLELLYAFRTARWHAAGKQTVEALSLLKEKTQEMLQRWKNIIWPSEATSTTEAFDLANARVEDGRLDETTGRANLATDDGGFSKTVEAVHSATSTGTLPSPTAQGDAESDNGSTSSSFDSLALEYCEDLIDSDFLAKKYEIVQGAVPGKLNIRFAVAKERGQEIVVLKFFSEDEIISFMLSLKVHQRLRRLRKVCTLYEAVSSPRLMGNALVFKRGVCTISDWLKQKPHFVMRKAFMHQVAEALRDLHAADIVHCDLTADNVVLFIEDLRWKLIDLEAAQKIGEEPQGEINIHYAAPEIIRAEVNGQPFPRVDPSRDIWALGVLMFEAFSETEFCDPESTLAEMADYTSKDEIRERLEAIKDDRCKNLVEHLLEVDPAKRWTAEDVVNSDVF